ncbi:hypothetical protein FA95DRAFT_1556958 [Auriscalpium vulgare]|uniref:Uncharacterized protein n=1 Tax=Auriscalpium vulgare TaxID=40419 RepID=A0ACB8RZI9_9AGAM|nr:hypothetical protein FA95DRAFT_1556958 [Auriscalpium vulgare]
MHLTACALGVLCYVGFVHLPLQPILVRAIHVRVRILRVSSPKSLLSIQSNSIRDVLATTKSSEVWEHADRRYPSDSARRR